MPDAQRVSRHFWHDQALVTGDDGALAQLRGRQDKACRQAVDDWHNAIEASLGALLREGVPPSDIEIQDCPGLVTRIVVKGVPRSEHRLIFTLTGEKQ